VEETQKELGLDETKPKNIKIKKGIICRVGGAGPIGYIHDFLETSDGWGVFFLPCDGTPIDKEKWPELWDLCEPYGHCTPDFRWKPMKPMTRWQSFKRAASFNWKFLTSREFRQECRQEMGGSMYRPEPHKKQDITCTWP
jgi:hypothetical protein